MAGLWRRISGPRMITVPIVEASMNPAGRRAKRVLAEVAEVTRKLELLVEVQVSEAKVGGR